MQSADPRTPVTVITGWLGAGKTTLLNRLLEEPGGRRYAVLINEFGEIGVDDKLVRHTAEDVVELKNGCVCCSVRGDLVAALEKLFRRRRPGLLRRARPFDRVLIETTGLAEPAPLLRTFLVEQSVAARYRPGSVVTLVDCRNAAASLSETAAREQVAVADLLLLNKTDLAEAAAVEELAARLRAMNPAARQVRAVRAAVDAEAVFAQSELPAASQPRDAAQPLEPHSHAGIGSVSLREERPLDELKVQLWLGACVKLLGARLLRYKGFLNLAGREHRVVLQGVYDLYSADQGEPWAGAPRVTELVFIGHDLDAEFLRKGLAATVAGA